MDVEARSISPRGSLAGCQYCSRCGKVFDKQDNLKLCPQDKATLVSVSDPFEGTEIGRDFELLELLGLGGWGVVYKARQVRLDRIVALKMLHQGLSLDQEISKRFAREAQLISLLHHASIAELIDYGVLPSGEPYMIMEYLEGIDLGVLLDQRARLSFEEAYPIVRQLCDALSAAHAQSIIHRDIKSSNIRVIDFGKKTVTAKLLDFGLACWSADSISQVSRLTAAGTTIGTPNYMSPEQCRGSVVDERSDVYSLGCIMYEMLTGTLPFVAANAFETMHGHIYREPAGFESHGIMVPQAVQQLVMQTLVKDPSKRVASAAELKRRLDQCYADGGKLSGLLSLTLHCLPPVALLFAALAWLAACLANFADFAPEQKTLPALLSFCLGGWRCLLCGYRRFLQDRNVCLFNQGVNELLQLPALIGGRKAMQQEDFQLVPLLEGCAELLYRKACERKISLATFVSPAIPAVLRGDPQQLRLVLMQLVDNLLDCPSHCQITIEAQAGAVSGKLATVYFLVGARGFAVSDSALGEPFRRTGVTGVISDNALPWSASSLGLGCIKRIVELMGGRLSLERRTGNSSLVSFALPFDAADDPQKRAEEFHLRSGRVLCAGVADNVSDAISEYVKSWGMACDAVTLGTAGEAIRRAAERREAPDVVLVDDADNEQAFEFAAAVSFQPLLASVHLVLLTDKKPSQDKALRSGFSAILDKPVKARRLLDCLARALASTTAPKAMDALPVTHNAGDDRPLVLLIDSDQEERRIVLIQLRILGVDAHAVNSVEEAQAGIAAGRYRLVIVDCSEPAGYQTARAVRKLQPSSPSPPAIVGLLERGDHKEQQMFCAAAGISQTIEKPIAPAALKNLVTSLMLADDDDTALVWQAEETIAPAQGFDTTGPLCAADADPINLTLLNESFGADTAQELLKVFAGTAEGLLDHIDRAMQRRHGRSLELLAHQLKGSASAIGAAEVARLAGRLEEAARKDDFTEALIIVEAIKFAVAKTARFIHQRQSVVLPGQGIV